MLQLFSLQQKQELKLRCAVATAVLLPRKYYVYPQRIERKIML